MGHQSNAQQLHHKGSGCSELDEQPSPRAAVDQKARRVISTNGSGGRHGTASERATDIAQARAKWFSEATV